MITDSYDLSEAIITLENFFGEMQNICDIAIATFSREIYPAMIEKYHGEQIGEFRSANLIRPIRGCGGSVGLYTGRPYGSQSFDG